MKFFLRTIQLLLMLFLLSFVGTSPGYSEKKITFPAPYDCYRSYEDITSRMVELTTLFPNLAHLKTIGLSYEERSIQVLQLGTEVETNAKPRLVLISGLKANAFAPVELNLRFAENLLNSYGSDANGNWLLEQTEIHLIVVANPDGRQIAEQQTIAGNAPTWSKNRHVYDCPTGNGGVSLSQNFAFGWSAGTQDDCAANYPGPSAASEPETLAIQTYLAQILAQNPEQSLVIDLQNNGDWLITPFLYSKTVENPFEDALYMLANKLAYDSQAMPSRGSNPTTSIITGNLTDFAFGYLQAPALLFNLGPALAGGDATQCWYFNEILEPEGLAVFTRAALLAANPLTQAQGPEITFSKIVKDAYTTLIAGQADDDSFYKVWLSPGEFSAVHHVAFSLDTPPWSPDAVMTQIPGESLPENPYQMDFQHTFDHVEFSPGKHILYFQAWDTNPSGEPGQAGMINAIEVNVMEINIPVFTFIPLLFR